MKSTGRRLLQGNMPNLVRYMDKHFVNAAELARALTMSRSGLINAITRGTMQRETCADIEQLFLAEGWKVPGNLFVNRKGVDRARRPDPLRRLSDGHIVTGPRGSQLSRARIAARYLAPQQLITTTNSQGDTEMVRLSLSAIKRFGLRADPFFNEMRSTDDVWTHSEHKKCLQAVEEAARSKDLLFVIGESGCGKTTVRNTFIETCPENVSVITPLAVGRANMTDNNLLDAVLHDLSGEVAIKGTIPGKREAKARKVLTMLEALKSNGRTAVLFIDDAHRLPKEIFRDLKVLHETQQGFRSLLGIILWGQNEAYKKLGDSTIREFTNRCAQFQWYGFGKQFPQYLEYKLARVGGASTKILTPDAMKAIEEVLTKKDGKFRFGPYALELNVLVTRAMNLADHTGESAVTAEIVDRVRPLESRPEARR